MVWALMEKMNSCKSKKGLVCGLADPFLFGVSAGMKWMASSLSFFSKNDSSKQQFLRNQYYDPGIIILSWTHFQSRQ